MRGLLWTTDTPPLFAVIRPMPRPDQIVHAPDALPVWPVWSKAVKSRGMVYVAGNIGCNPDVKTLVEGGIQGQTVRS